MMKFVRMIMKKHKKTYRSDSGRGGSFRFTLLVILATCSSSGSLWQTKLLCAKLLLLRLAQLHRHTETCSCRRKDEEDKSNKA